MTKLGRRGVPGQFQLFSQQAEKLAAPAVAVAVGFAAAENGDEQRDTEKQHPQPCEQDIEQPQKQVAQLGDPKVVRPPLFPCAFHSAPPLSTMLMTAAGHTFAHLPQPTHFSSSTWAETPHLIWIASFGQTGTQVPQATHSLPIWETRGCAARGSAMVF